MVKYKGNFTEILTDRLKLRKWKHEDLAPFSKLNSDKVAMEHFPSTLTEDASNKLVEENLKHFSEYGYGVFAVELVDNNQFIGSIGLKNVTLDIHFAPCIEIAWRLLPEYWGKGYASEAAKAAINFGFNELGIDEIVAYTIPKNIKSQKVMKNIGMKYAFNFDHPRFIDNPTFCDHVLYKIRK